MTSRIDRSALHVIFLGDFVRREGLLDVVSLDEVAGEITYLDCDGTGTCRATCRRDTRSPV